uniref:Sodium-dependent dopamine transporter (inferred by orthology to a human protein) n=1 Tax=Strongyloides venezuelensis TaxID=75913 RepID=A0A0K0G1P0_STRVS
MSSKSTKEIQVVSEGIKKDEKIRGEWGGRIFFILTAIGCAVGLGNIWRFPYVAYENGGSAFLIPYFLSSLLIGIPMLQFEMNYGQFSRAGCGTAFKSMMPVGQGIGWVMLVNSFLIATFYIMIMAYILLYLYTILIGQANTYVSCDNPWNTLSCISSIKNLNCYESRSKSFEKHTKAIFLNNTCHYGYTDEEIFDIRNNYFKNISGTPTSATEEFFDRYILRRTNDFDNLGDFNWKLFYSLTFSWILIFLFSWKGVKILGKISIFTSIFPYIVVIAFLIKSFELDGSMDGLKFYLLEPDFSLIFDYKTWVAASTQLIFSFSIGMGNMHTLASYNSNNHNVFVDVGVIAAADVFMSIVGGGVVFGILGFLAKKTGKKIPDVVASGTTLAFVVYPEATSLMSYSNIWAFSYFLMLFLIGASTQVCFVDLIVTAFYDSFESTRKHRSKIVLISCFLMYICGIIFCYDGGIYYFTIFNEYTTGFNLVFVLILELFSVTIFYGIKNFMNDIRSMIGSPKNKFSSICGPTGSFVKYCWLFLTPLILLSLSVTLIYSFITENPSYGVGDKIIHFPKKAKYLGYTLAFSSLIPLFVFFFLNAFIYGRRGKSFKELFKPLETWPSYKNNEIKVNNKDVEGCKSIKSTKSLKNKSKVNSLSSPSSSFESNRKSNNTNNAKKVSIKKFSSSEGSEKSTNNTENSKSKLDKKNTK